MYFEMTYVSLEVGGVKLKEHIKITTDVQILKKSTVLDNISFALTVYIVYTCICNSLINLTCWFCCLLTISLTGIICLPGIYQLPLLFIKGNERKSEQTYIVSASLLLDSATHDE